MARHYSSIVIQLPEPGEPPDLVIHFECDRCPPAVWTTHVEHLGTLVRVLTAVYAQVGGDDGVTEHFGDVRRGPASATALEGAKAQARSATAAFKARRVRERDEGGT